MAGHDAFKMVFESYNRNLHFIIDMSQRCIALVLVYLGVFFSLHKTSDCHEPISWSSFGLIYAVALLSLGFFVWMGRKYRERCENCVIFLSAYDKVDLGVALEDLGIISGEHRRIIGMWSWAFVSFLVAMLIFIGIYQWNGYNCASAPAPSCAAIPSAAPAAGGRPHFRIPHDPPG